MGSALFLQLGVQDEKTLRTSLKESGKDTANVSQEFFLSATRRRLAEELGDRDRFYAVAAQVSFALLVNE
jgi:hypothetical protein